MVMISTLEYKWDTYDLHYREKQTRFSGSTMSSNKRNKPAFLKVYFILCIILISTDTSFQGEKWIRTNSGEPCCLIFGDDFNWLSAILCRIRKQPYIFDRYLKVCTPTLQFHRFWATPTVMPRNVSWHQNLMEKLQYWEERLKLNARKIYVS